MKKILLALMVCLMACQPKTSKKEYYADINGHRVPIVRLDLVNDSAYKVPLSTIFSDVKIVPLETSKESLIGYCDGYMTDHSIIIAARNYRSPIRLYEFDLDGKFLREFGHPGKGPGEHVGNSFANLDYYPKEKKILATFVGGPEENLVFDLEGNFIQSVKLPNCEVECARQYSENVFMTPGDITSIPRFKRDSFQVLFFKPNGEVIKELPRKVYPRSNQVGYCAPGMPELWRYQGDWKIYYEGNDTIYRMSIDSLIPSGIIKGGEKVIPYNQFVDPKFLKGKFRFQISRESDHWLYLTKQFVYKMEAEEPLPGRWNVSSYYLNTTILYDKSLNIGYNIEFKDDILGILPDNTVDQNYYWNEFGSPYRIDQASDVLAWIKEAENDVRVPQKSKERLAKLKQRLNESSNPVIFIFTQRKEAEMGARLKEYTMK